MTPPVWRALRAFLFGALALVPARPGGAGAQEYASLKLAPATATVAHPAAPGDIARASQARTRQAGMLLIRG